MECAVLDPREPAQRPALREWLAYQLATSSRPLAAAALLRRVARPRTALALLRLAAPPAARIDLALAQLERCAALGVLRGSPQYPSALERISDPPPLLWVRGRLECVQQPAIAIVGARASSRYGERVAAEFAAAFARAGLCVVSGLARGIDAAAHRAALEQGGSTVAVQGCGPDRVFPAAHRALADEIAAAGALVSELPPGTPPLKPHFPMRNRLISGLARAVVVVEARRRSGSLVTARHALDQGVDVFAVPGPIDAPLCQGTNQLIWDGAWPALDPARVLDRIGLGAATPAEQAGIRLRTHAEREPMPNDALAARIEVELAHASLSADELARALGVPPEQLALPLLQLELSGRILAERDGRLRRCS